MSNQEQPLDNSLADIDQNAAPVQIQGRRTERLSLYSTIQKYEPQVIQNKAIQNDDDDPLTQIEKENNEVFFCQVNRFFNQKITLYYKSKETDFYVLSNMSENIDQRTFNTFTTFIDRNLTQQIFANIVEYGQPTVFKKNWKWLIVGTSCGVVIKYLLKDKCQTQQILTVKKDHLKKGAVTAIDISFDNKVILVGYNNGHLDLYQLEKNSRIQVFKDLHTDCVLKIKYVHESFDSFIKQEFISSDEKGNIYRSIVSVNTNMRNILQKQSNNTKSL